jgi:uncharacterized membrane protein (UPF0127 family)
MMRLVRAGDGQVVVDDLRVAGAFLSRARGLMGRARLAPGEGLWIEPCNSIHMMFMRFAIDVLFLQRSGPRPPAPGTEGEVVQVRSGVRPWLGLAWCSRASSTVELEAGRAEALGIEPGDLLVVEKGER